MMERIGQGIWHGGYYWLAMPGTRRTTACLIPGLTLLTYEAQKNPQPAFAILEEVIRLGERHSPSFCNRELIRPPFVRHMRPGLLLDHCHHTSAPYCYCPLKFGVSVLPAERFLLGLIL